MEPSLNLNVIEIMDLFPLALALVLGYGGRLIGLPPLVGFLVAGFILGGLEYEKSQGLQKFADLGVTLLLFTIGLKLNVRNLLSPSIWATSSLHMIVITLLGAGLLKLMAILGVPPFAGLDHTTILLLGFALSFSSTVFAVKVFEETGEAGATHAKVAIGVLIMQDIFAVLFMTASTGKIPSPWAFLLLLLFPLRPLFIKFIQSVGHGELLTLSGWLIPLGGASLFEYFGVKADLGALIVGVLLAGTPKADELSKSLYSFKDLFLIGFFLTIGLTGQLTGEWILCSFILLTLLPIKTALYFWFFTKFRLRARSSCLASLGLSNYSEFGLIVIALGASMGMLDGEWLIGMALALSISFVMASPLNRFGNSIYNRYHDQLVKYESEERLHGDEIIDTHGAKVLVFGMGRVGASAYDYLSEKVGEGVVGIDYDEEAVEKHQAADRNVILGDATDTDFWARKKLGQELELILLTFPDHGANCAVAKMIRKRGFTTRLDSIATYPDQIPDLKAAGIDRVFNFYAEAGFGFAEHAWLELGLEEKLGKTAKA